MPKSIYLTSALIIILSFIASGQTVTPPDIKLMQEINDAWATLDTRNAAKYYDKSPGNIYYDISPFEYRGWEAYSSGAAEVLKNLTSMKYTVGDDAVIRKDENTAFGTAALHLESTDKEGTKSSIDLRWTVIWEKKENEWLIVHEHLSVPAAVE